MTTSPEPGSLLDLIRSAGFDAAEDIERLQDLAARAQQHRVETRVSRETGLTRSTALWAAMQIEGELREVLEVSGISAGKLEKDLKLPTKVIPTRPAPTRLHSDFANAMSSYLDQRTSSSPVTLVEVVLAILQSVRTYRGGALPRRIGSVDSAIAKLNEITRSSASPGREASGPETFSRSIESLRTRLANDPAVTPGVIATALQRSGGHQDYAGGAFVGVDFASSGPGAPFEEWCRRVQGRYDMEQVRKSSHGVIDGRLFLLGLAALDPGFREDLERNGVRDALVNEITVPEPRLPDSLGELAGGLSSEYVDPTVGIGLDRDQMGVAPYVSMLATVICDKATPMPLSVGIFGEWGSGKSFFMGLLRGRIDDLRRSENDRYWQDIRQISFNAWHYADSNLWASLGDEIFRQLLHKKEDEEPDFERQQALRNELTDLLAQRRELEAAVADAEVEASRLRTQIQRALAKRDVRAADLLTSVKKSPSLDKQLTRVWRLLGVRDEHEQARVLASEVSGTINEITVIRRSLGDRRGLVTALVAIAVLLAVTGVALIAPSLETLVRAAAASVGMFLTAAVAITTAVRQGLKRLRTLIEEIQSGAGEAVTARQSRELLEEMRALRDAEAATELAEAQLATVVARAGELGRELAELAPGHRLYSFLADRVSAGDYTRNLGLISTIRKDFEQLTQLMSRWRDRQDLDEKAPRPLDRIVLYIDDLDRCNPQQVVDVLQAVHLLLALDLFVVVVGVDPRWLARSLQQRFPKLLEPGEIDAAEDDGWEASPEDYLEKIFSIPLVLPGMSPGRLEPLLHAIMGDPRRRGSELGNLPPAPDPTPHTKESSSDSGALIVEEHSEVAEQIQPGGLPIPPPRQITEPEVRLLAALEPLLRTPREAKRLANLYRMIRATRDLSEASDFMGDDGEPGEYEAVIVLLGLLTAHARLLGAVLDSPTESGLAGGLLSRPSSQTWSEFVKSLEPRGSSPRWHNGVVADLSASDRDAWNALWSGLQPITAQVTLHDLRKVQEWAPSIRRFSFVMSASATQSGPQARRTRDGLGTTGE